MTKQVSFATPRGAKIEISLTDSGRAVLSFNGGELKSFERLHHPQAGAAVTFENGVVGNKVQKAVAPIPADKVAAVDALIAEGHEILHQTTATECAGAIHSNKMYARMYGRNSDH